jgi:predicted enzyme related to lactoylglutathione lyase
MPRVVHFEIPADDCERAVKFYGKVFGWKIDKWEGPADYWLVTTGEETEPGIDGAIFRREREDAAVTTVSVPDVAEYVKKVEEAGGKVIMARVAIPRVGWFAKAADTEGNIFGLMQDDADAK